MSTPKNMTFAIADVILHETIVRAPAPEDFTPYLMTAASSLSQAEDDSPYIIVTKMSKVSQLGDPLEDVSVIKASPAGVYQPEQTTSRKETTETRDVVDLDDRDDGAMARSPGATTTPFNIEKQLLDLDLEIENLLKRRERTWGQQGSDEGATLVKAEITKKVKPSCSKRLVAKAVDPHFVEIDALAYWRMEATAAYPGTINEDKGDDDATRSSVSVATPMSTDCVELDIQQHGPTSRPPAVINIAPELTKQLTELDLIIANILKGRQTGEDQTKQILEGECDESASSRPKVDISLQEGEYNSSIEDKKEENDDSVNPLEAKTCDSIFAKITTSDDGVEIGVCYSEDVACQEGGIITSSTALSPFVDLDLEIEKMIKRREENFAAPIQRYGAHIIDTNQADENMIASAGEEASCQKRCERTSEAERKDADVQKTEYIPPWEIAKIASDIEDEDDEEVNAGKENQDEAQEEKQLKEQGEGEERDEALNENKTSEKVEEKTVPSPPQRLVARAVDPHFVAIDIREDGPLVPEQVITISPKITSQLSDLDLEIASLWKKRQKVWKKPARAMAATVQHNDMMRADQQRLINQQRLIKEQAARAQTIARELSGITEGSTHEECDDDDTVDEGFTAFGDIETVLQPVAEGASAWLEDLAEFLVKVAPDVEPATEELVEWYNETLEPASRRFVEWCNMTLIPIGKKVKVWVNDMGMFLLTIVPEDIPGKISVETDFFLDQVGSYLEGDLV